VAFWGARCAAWPVVKAPPQKKKNSAAQARAWADGDFDADHGFAFDGMGRPAH
jgi:hypothetical protein